MLKNTTQRQQLAAFTLIEILVTVSLTSIIMMGITTLFISLITSAGKSRLSQSIRENGIVAMQKMIEELRNTKAVDGASLICNGLTEIAGLPFNNADGIASLFSADNNRITLTVNSSNNYLTCATNQLKDCKFF